MGLGELSKATALRNNNIDKFSKILEGGIPERDLTIKDVVDPALLHELDSLDNEGDDNEETNQLIEDIWEDFSKTVLNSNSRLESQVKDEVNERLCQYLRENSEHISGGIERHIKNISQGKDVGMSENRLSNLNMLSYERKEFMKTLVKIRDAFKVEMRGTKIIAASRAKTMVTKIFEDLKKLFKGEYTLLADEFNKVRYKLLREERLVRETKTMNVTLEELNT